MQDAPRKPAHDRNTASCADLGCGEGEFFLLSDPMDEPLPSPGIARPPAGPPVADTPSCQTLKHRVVRGGIWLASGDAAARIANFAKLAILVRFLSPVHFGLMGMAMIVLRWLNAFTDTGVNRALIRKDGEIRLYFDTTWTIQILRGLLTGGILCLTAPGVARFFESMELAAVLQAIALIPVLNGFRNPAIVALQKRLDPRGEVVWKLGGVIAGFIVAAPLAFFLKSVWALVFSAIAAAAAEIAVSYWVLPYRPRLGLDWGQARDLSGFGKWVLFSNIGGFLFLTLDAIIIGKVLGAESLGVYQLGYQLAVMPMAQLGMLSNSIMFPAFSELRHPHDSRRTFLKVMGLAWSVLLPAGCFLAACADPLVWLVFGAKWSAVVPVVQILAWGGVALALSMLGNAFFLGIGQPHLASHVTVLRLILLAALLYPCIRYYGLGGAATAVAVSSAGAAFYQLALMLKLVGPSFHEATETVKVGLFGSLLFALAALVVRPAPSLSFLALITLATLTYLLFLLRSLRSRFGLPGNLGWARSLRETLTF